MNKSFPTGRIVMTIGIKTACEENSHFGEFILNSLGRHMNCDWGDVCDEDWADNDDALTEGYRLFSAYTIEKQKIWIITEADRSVTTILFPDEY